MRKIFLFVFLLIFLGILGLFSNFAKETYAAPACTGDPGSPCTICMWDPGTGCVVDTAASSSCINGLAPDQSVCDGLDDSLCGGFRGQCKDTSSAGKCYKYKGTDAGCVEYDEGSSECSSGTHYDTRDECEAAQSPGSKYRCDQVSHTCSLDSNCTDATSCFLTSSDCESTCVGPTNAPLSRPCSDADNSDKGCVRIKTAFGFVSTGANNFTRWLLGFVLSISGGIVILIIIISGYRLMTSQGDPEKVKNARDQLTAAIVGLLFIIFSLVILELITSDVLGLPGFGSP